MNDLDKKLKDFRVKMLPEYSMETLKRASRCIERFSRLGLDVFGLDMEWIYEYCSRELEHGKMKKSLRSEMEDLQRWALYTDQNIKLPHFKKEPDPDPWLPTEEQYSRILEACTIRMHTKIRDCMKQKEHERKWFTIGLIIKVFGEGGMRVSELVRINRDDVSEKGLFIRSSKKEKNRLVALAPDTIESIHKYILNYRPETDQKALFTGDYGRLTAAMLRKYMKQAGKASGVGELHPHALRHFCATRLLKSGIDIRKIQIHLGHSDIASTTVYTHHRGSDVYVEIHDLYINMKNEGFQSWVQTPGISEIEYGGSA